MKKLRVLSAVCLLAFLLCGCGQVFRADYYHETDYRFPEPESKPQQEKLTVKTYGELKDGLLAMVYAGESEGRIAFDQEYEGDSRADLDAACGTMHREDALWAYCVQTVRYEISHIITHDEADIRVEYADSALGVGEVLQLNYATGLDRILKTAMEENRSHLVILIGKSSYSADAMTRLVSSVYRSNPGCSAAEPTADVYMYSGAGRQRLYDIDLDYGMDQEELQRRKEALRAFDAREVLHAEDQTLAMAALTACTYLTENCALNEGKAHNTVYDALIKGEANSEGLALAYVELCRQVDVPCQIVYGQYQWKEHCWNIIELDGEHYHVDLTACMRDGVENGFLLNDESMWAEYRWDTASYELCAGPLDYWTLTGTSRYESPSVPAAPEETPVPSENPEETPVPTERPEETPAPSDEPEETPAPTEQPVPTEEPEAGGE